MFATLPSSDPSPVESVYIYGKDETATSTLAVGLALRRRYSFSWADCADRSGDALRNPMTSLARGQSRGTGSRAEGTDWTVPRWAGGALEGLLVPEKRTDLVSLMSYLTLPGLLQELAARSTSPLGDSAVVLITIDALEAGLRASVFGKSDLGRRLHQAKVALYATSRSRLPRDEISWFDQIFRLEAPDETIWWKTTLTAEKGSSSLRTGSCLPLKGAWTSLGLDPTLLPPV